MPIKRAAESDDEDDLPLTARYPSSFVLLWPLSFLMKQLVQQTFISVLSLFRMDKKVKKESLGKRKKDEDDDDDYAPEKVSNL